MAYVDEMALEREKSKQALLAGKQPLLGDDTVKAMHALGVNLGLVPPGTPPSAMTQLLESFVGLAGPKGIHVDNPKDLQVSPVALNRAPSTNVNPYSDGSGDLGGVLKGILDAAKGGGLKQLRDKLQQAQAPTGVASVRDRSLSGAAARAQRQLDNTPGPYAKGEAATQWTQEKIPGLKPGIDASKAEPGRAAADAYLAQQKGGGGVTVVGQGAATGDRIVPGADLKGVDPRIAEIVGAAAEALPPGYKVSPTSGVRATGQGQHTKAAAADWQIIDPNGKPVPNRGDDTTGLYTKLAKNAYGYQEQNHPELTGQFQWGGQFGTSANNPNEPDLMHFDIGGRRGRIGKYSRETIGAELPPGAKGAAEQPPAWDKGLPQQDAKTNWPAATETTPASQLPQPAAPAAPQASLPSTATPRADGVPPDLSKLIMSKEWFTPNAKDDYGQKSIGYGTSANGRTSITEPEARAEMNAQLQRHLNKIDQNFPNLSPDVRNSVASLTYNVGEGWMSEKGNTLAAALKAGNMPAAKQAFMQYVHVTDANGNKSTIQGLVNRRTDEARAFDGQKPQYTKNPDAPAGSQPNVAAAAPIEKPQVPAAETAMQTMRDREPATVAAAPPSAFDKGRADAVPYSGVGGLFAALEVRGLDHRGHDLRPRHGSPERNQTAGGSSASGGAGCLLRRRRWRQWPRLHRQLHLQPRRRRLGRPRRHRRRCRASTRPTACHSTSKAIDFLSRSTLPEKINRIPQSYYNTPMRDAAEIPLVGGRGSRSTASSRSRVSKASSLRRSTRRLRPARRRRASAAMPAPAAVCSTRRRVWPRPSRQRRGHNTPKPTPACARATPRQGRRLSQAPPTSRRAGERRWRLPASTARCHCRSRDRGPRTATPRRSS